MEPHYHHDYPAVDQQQHLLQPGSFPAVPTSAVHLADQIERGGAKIEDTLTRLNCRYQSLFFLASWGIVFGAVLATLNSLFHFAVVNFVNSIFLLAFGCIMLVLDIPGNPRWAGHYRKSLRKYCRFLTRLTGKALWFLYLGCMTVVCLWPQRGSNAPAFLLFVAFFLSVLVISVALLGLFIALRKSLRLEKLRRALQQSYHGNWPEVYRKYAVNDPSHGMQYEEFNRMASDYTQGRLMFDLTDLQIIYNALDEHQKSAINEIEFGQWVSAGARDDQPYSAGGAKWMTYL